MSRTTKQVQNIASERSAAGLSAEQAAQLLAMLRNVLDSLQHLEKRGDAVCAGLAALLPADTNAHPDLAFNGSGDRASRCELKHAIRHARVLAVDVLPGVFEDLDSCAYFHLEAAIAALSLQSAAVQEGGAA